MARLILIFGILISLLGISNAQSAGVCYGMDGDNLPSRQEVVDLYKANRIGRMRIYHPDPATLQALRGSNIELILGVPNDKLSELGDPNAATTWVQNNIAAYRADVKFKYVAVGNEVPPGDPSARLVLPAMQNVQNAIAAIGLQNQIKVSTAIDMKFLEDSSPPSRSKFSASAGDLINPIIGFLVQNGSPLLVNVYPYFSYIGNKVDIKLEYALFNSPGVVVQDGPNGYQNLFDALVDVVYSALEKAGGGNVRIVVSESGWPSAAGDDATPENAGTYYRNLINHIKQGTPKRKGEAIETYLFAMFDENLKPEPPFEQHFGVFLPSKQSKYQLNFG